MNPETAVVDPQMTQMRHLAASKPRKGSHSTGEFTAVEIGAFICVICEQKEMFDAFLDIGVAGYVLKENAPSELIACLKAIAAGEPYVSPSLTRLLLRRRQAVDQLRSERPGLDRLTPSERRILILIAEDKTSKEIAAQLGVSPNTVNNHRANICEKLALRGTHSLLKFAFDNESRLAGG